MMLFCTKKTQVGGEKRPVFVCFEKKSFLEHTKRRRRDFRGGPHSLSRHSLNVLKTRSCHATERRAQRDTHRQRDDRDLTLETSDRGRFSLSLSLRKSARERVKNRSRTYTSYTEEERFQPFERYKNNFSPCGVEKRRKRKRYFKIGK